MAYVYTSPSCLHMAPHLQALVISIGLLLASMPMLLSGMELIHVDADGSFTREELIDRAVKRTQLKAEMLSATPTHGGDGTGTDSVASVHNHHEYLMKIGIGTPRVDLWAVFDTGSDLVWTKKDEVCDSSTFTKVTCSVSVSNKMCGRCGGGLCGFKKMFGHAKKMAEGFMGYGTLTLPRGDENNIYIVSLGCATHMTKSLLPEHAEGIVGLNRGHMSLVQQLNLANFSYCLSDQLTPELSSRLWLGDGYDLDQLRAGPQGEKLSTTPLVQVENIQDHPGLSDKMYFVQLEGISVGENFKYKTLPKDSFNLKSKKDKDKGVMFVDSGCSHTLLETKVFEALLELLDAKLKKRNNMEEKPCFQPGAAAASTQPEMVLYFADGAKMSLPWANYMDKKKNDESFCLTIKQTTTSILGNFQQQNTYMLYNLTQGHETLSFVQDFDCHQKP